jgi:hypothetical protein
MSKEGDFSLVHWCSVGRALEGRRLCKAIVTIAALATATDSTQTPPSTIIVTDERRYDRVIGDTSRF